MEGSQDNILTTVDNITLQSNMIYTIQVSSSNLEGEFNITSNENFSKWIMLITIISNNCIFIYTNYNYCIVYCITMHEHVVYNIDMLL